MRVKNRSGDSVEVSYDKIKHRLQELCKHGRSLPQRRHDGVVDGVDIDEIVIETIKGMYDGITTAQLDDMSARVCVALQIKSPAYDALAGRIVISNIHKTIGRMLELPHDAYAPFSAKVAYIRDHAPGVYNADFLRFVEAHGARLDAMSDYERDFEYNYFSARTMEMGYLLKVRDVCVESPQDMWMRVAVAVNCRYVGDGDVSSDKEKTEKTEKTEHDALDRVRRCYDQMSRGLFTHATPTLFNAGTRFEQMSSCYLLGIRDSLDGIFGTLADCAQISKWAGGIGVHISNVRARGSRIASTNGASDGIVPMLKVFNETARYCNQSGRRKGSIAAYLEPWHADVFEFVELRKNTGAETQRARDLFLALWVPDLFMQCVIDDDDWYLMSADACPGLQDAHGRAFAQLYQRYVQEGRYMRKVRARALWRHVLQAQIETGVPYVLFKDNVNAMCNQQNLGTIKSSNLCAEITEFSDSDTYAVCNLASIAVNRFVVADAATSSSLRALEEHTVPVTTGTGENRRTVDVPRTTPRTGVAYDFVALHDTAKLIAHNLNRIIDANFYPTPQTRRSNFEARPIGIGVQGFADLYSALGLEYEDDASVQLDAEVMETIYHGALEGSVELARAHGPYERFPGSPFSQGRLQMDLWAADPKRRPVRYSGRWDWDALRADVVKYGTRNSLVTALMPTATTAQILGNSETFEPPHSNVFKRTTLAGEFMVVNKALVADLIAAGAWKGEATMNALIHGDGNIQHMDDVPDQIKRVYKTVWDVQQKSLMDHAVARAPFVDQSQSMNLFFSAPNTQKLHSALIYAWKQGLKTGMYYLRSKPATEAIKIAGGSSSNNNSHAPQQQHHHHQSATATAEKTRRTRAGHNSNSSSNSNASASVSSRQHHTSSSHPAPPHHQSTPSPLSSLTCSLDGMGCESCSS